MAQDRNIGVRFLPQGIDAVLTAGRPLSAIYDKLGIPRMAFTRNNQFYEVEVLDQALQDLLEGRENAQTRLLSNFFDFDVVNIDEGEATEVTLLLNTVDSAAAERARSKRRAVVLPPGVERLKRSLATTFLAQDPASGLFYKFGECRQGDGCSCAPTLS